MNNKPLISIITVCYNVADDLELTIASVKEQGYSDIEHIIVDGASVDNTVDIIESYSESITKEQIKLKWVSEIDSGIYDAMNKGLNIATGDWVVFLNAGDSFASKSILQDIFSVSRSSDVIFGKSITRYKELTAIRYLDFETQNRNWYLRKMPNHQAIFINKSLYEKHRYDLSFKYFSDTFFLRAIFDLASKVDEVSFPICIFELGGKSNFYGGFSTYKAIVSDSIRINKTTIIPILKHTLKYSLQLLLGKNIYLNFYIKTLDK
jgi:glycosyltransferase involved in cell wall biosynthesis